MHGISRTVSLFFLWSQFWKRKKKLFWSEERVLNLVLKFVLVLLVFKLMIYCHDGAYGNLGFFWIKTHPDSSTGAWQQFRSVLISQCGHALQFSVIPDKGYVIGKVTRWNDCLQLSYVDVNNLWFLSLGVNSVRRLLRNKHNRGTDVL